MRFLLGALVVATVVLWLLGWLLTHIAIVPVVLVGFGVTRWWLRRHHD